MARIVQLAPSPPANEKCTVVRKPEPNIDRGNISPSARSKG